MLFIHEVHKVVGKSASQFEEAYRGGWMPKLAEGSDARLLWYLDLAHGSGLAYRAVTVTAVTDGAAWQRLAERVAGGDLQSWARQLDGLQHQSTSRIMLPLEWSPSIDLAEVPTDPDEHEPTMYMEDTMWPFPGKDRRLHRGSWTASTSVPSNQKTPGWGSGSSLRSRPCPEQDGDPRSR